MIIINIHFELTDVSELTTSILAAILVSTLVSFAFISEEANYFKNFIYFLSIFLLAINSKPIIDLLLKIFNFR